MPFSLMGALKGGLEGLAQSGGRRVPQQQAQQPQSSWEGQLLNGLVESGKIKPQRASYWLKKQREEGMSSLDILSSLTDDDYVNPERDESQKIASIITNAVNARTGGGPIAMGPQTPSMQIALPASVSGPQGGFNIGGQMPIPGLPQYAAPGSPKSKASAELLSRQNLPVISPQAGLMNRLAQEGSSLDAMKKTEGLFPSLFQELEQVSPLKQREFELKSKALDVEELRIKQQKEEGDWRRKLAFARLGLDERKLGFEQVKELRRYTTQQIEMIAEVAQNIAGTDIDGHDKTVEPEHTAEAIQRLIVLNDDFRSYAKALEQEEPGSISKLISWLTKGKFGGEPGGITMKKYKFEPKAEDHYGEWGL